LAVTKLLNDLINRSSKKTTQVAREAGLPRIVLYDLLRCRRLFKADYIDPLAKALDLGPEVISQLTALAAECRQSDQSPSEVAASPEMIALGMMLRATRKSLGKALPTISAELGMHTPNYSNYERGLRRMSMATAHRIVRTLKMPDQTAKDFLNLVAATNSKVRCPVPASTSSGVGQLQLELSRRGIAIADGDRLTTQLTSKTFIELQAVLPQLQQLNKLVQIQLAQSATQPPPLNETPFSAIIEHANGSTTFVVNAAPNPVEPVPTSQEIGVSGSVPQDSGTDGESH
jgi:transcriptional regulator with XRE-family HTH domain